LAYIGSLVGSVVGSIFGAKLIGWATALVVLIFGAAILWKFLL